MEARTGLEEAVGTRGIEALRSAIAEGESAGLEESELESARTVLAEEERKVAARGGLEKASESREIDALRSAIEEGESAGLGAAEITGAKGVLAEEERKVAARAELEKAVGSCDIDSAERLLLHAIKLDKRVVAAHKFLGLLQLQFRGDVEVHIS